MGGATAPVLPAMYSRVINSCSHMEHSETLASGPRALLSSSISSSPMPPNTRNGRAALYNVTSRLLLPFSPNKKYTAVQDRDDSLNSFRISDDKQSGSTGGHGRPEMCSASGGSVAMLSIRNVDMATADSEIK